MQNEGIEVENTELDLPSPSPNHSVAYSNTHISTPAHCSRSSISTPTTSNIESSCTQKKRRRETGVSTNEVLRDAVDKMTAIANEKDDEFDVFGMTIGHQLRHM